MLQFTQLSYFQYSLDDLVGFIPEFLSNDDPRPAKEQIDAAYQHGGGWRRFNGFEYCPDDHSIKYPGDPRMMPVASCVLHADSAHHSEAKPETIYVYPSAWVNIVQADGSYEIARID